ncbi:hypothetical protein FisN_9Lh196 [Fistulifera solaris]|uniref:Uncharacterized protein n=1 Tax=Fistulifera solaris TaxID=1519565 RepID=A0A1Z5KKQ2_FISSO|nr:hypothetical protein FisN_9Lh196 [Fistulifera solaris]|eukprot:GAX26900.1 hypothetical protein FisN_9Lh196 [Fistulifera solaris]
MTNETEDSPYGVPDKPEKSPSMSHGGWIGGDSDAMLGVSKEKKWTKPVAPDHHERELLNTEWLGSSAASTKKWKKPDELKSDRIVVASPVKTEAQETESSVETTTSKQPEINVPVAKDDPAPPLVPDETPEPSETTDKQDYEYGVPDKPEGGVPGMRHSGWIGGDSDALLGVKKERRWSKPTTRQEKHEAGGERLCTEWLGVPTSPVKKWTKPAATEKLNSDWIGGTAMLSPVRTWKQSGAKATTTTLDEHSPTESTAIDAVINSVASVQVSELPVSGHTEPHEADDASAPQPKTEVKVELWSETELSSDVPDETPETSEATAPDKQDYEYGVPDKPEAGVPGMRHGGWIGGDSDALLEVKKERRWSKPTTRQEKHEAGGEHLNTDWLGGEPASPAKKWTKPAATGKSNSDWIGGTAMLSPVRTWKQSGATVNSAPIDVSSPQQQSTHCPSTQKTVDSTEASESKSVQVSNSKPVATTTLTSAIDESPYGVPDKPEAGVPGMRHSGWIGGDSDALLGVEKERRWSKPTTREEKQIAGGEHLNTDWLGGVPASPAKKWKKPVS